MSDDFDLTPVDNDPFGRDEAAVRRFDEIAKRLFGWEPSFADRAQALGGDLHPSPSPASYAASELIIAPQRKP
jgi:hypothetical protein